MSSINEQAEFGINANSNVNVSPLQNPDDDTNPAPTVNKCVCAIVSNCPYDSSVFPNNETTYYTTVSYGNLTDLTDLLSGNNSSGITAINMLYVANCFTNPDMQMIFRFMCSPDCKDGVDFIDDKTTDNVYKFVKIATSRNSIIEVSDHSMASFFNNWNDTTMEMTKPIEIRKRTTSGPFKMTGTKELFMSSCHPTLKQIGDMSATDAIEITFNNMGGTKIFDVIESAKPEDLKVISHGYEIERMFRHNLREVEQEKQVPEEVKQEKMPVHCEFKYRMGTIVVSATHWCNLNQVETPIDLDKLRRYCTETLGAEATQSFENCLSSMSDPNDIKREISSCVRGISSGGSSGLPYKKQKMTSNGNGLLPVPQLSPLPPHPPLYQQDQNDEMMSFDDLQDK